MCQTIYFLDIRNMVVNNSTVKFSIRDKLKQTKPTIITTITTHVLNRIKQPAKIL